MDYRQRSEYAIALRKAWWDYTGDTAYSLLDQFDANRLSTSNLRLYDQQTATFNLLHAMMDTARTALLAPNPRVEIVPTNKISDNDKAIINLYISDVFNTNDIHRLVETVITHNLVQGFGVFDVRWNAETDTPFIRVPDIGTVLYDPSTTDLRQTRFIIEYEVMSEQDFTGKVAKGIFTQPEYTAQQFGRYPQQFMSEAQYAEMQQVLNLEYWVIVYHWWDLVEKVKYTFTEYMDLAQEVFTHCPFVNVDVVNTNKGQRGVAEARLGERAQAIINELFDNVQTALRNIRSLLLYDPTKLGEENVKKLQQGLEVGNHAMVPFPLVGGATINEALYSWSPQPLAEAVIKGIELIESRAMTETAHLESARGKQLNVRTAAEMHAMQSMQAARLLPRITRLNRGLINVAALVISLTRDYRKTRITTRYGKLAPQLTKYQFTFEAVVNSPDPMGVEQRLQIMANWMPILQQQPGLDPTVLSHQLADLLKLDPSVKRTPPEPAPGAPTESGEVNVDGTGATVLPQM